MALDPAISLSYQPTQAAVNPFGLALQASQMRAQQQEIQQRDLAMQQARRQQADDEQYRQAIQASAGLTPDELLAHVQSTAPGHYLAVQKALDESREKASQAKSAAATAASAQAQAALHQQNYISHLVNSVDQADYNPVVFNAALNDAVQAFPEWKGHADELRSIAATQGKDALKAALQPFMGADVRKTNAETANTAAELPGKVAQSAIATQVAAGTVGGLTPEQQATGTRADATQKETARHNRTEEGFQSATGKREAAKFDLTYGTGKDDNGQPVASPQAKAIASYQMPGFQGRAAATGLGQAVMNQVLAINPAYDASKFPARNKMRIAFTSGPQSQTLNSLNTAIEHLDQFVGFAQGMGNGSFQPTNEIKNWIKTQFGDTAPTNFEGIRTVLSGEVAAALKKSGATDTEIANVEKTMQGKSSTPQLVDYATKVIIPALGSKAGTFDAQWKQTMGDKDPFSVYTPGAKAVLDKYAAPKAAPVGGFRVTEIK